ncbi:hypothetical protein GGS23DRAFT_567852 [Durotheca rogersii]|uniref:uncharacterized protein n=1 Tax=Durotheca rogersii TaxID=419775 RepID=UPI00221E9119|nr:uncharacterized protein GGS23DRAFT_567852 [Durotheca rogersii]KAI5863024.1 hypothetical protein GGS23DRAFT_567852 [Durotheca rogersii]
MPALAYPTTRHLQSCVYLPELARPYFLLFLGPLRERKTNKMNSDVELKNGTSYLARLDSFRQFDKEREELVKDLVVRYEELQKRFENKCEECNGEIEARTRYQAEAEAANKKLKGIRQNAVNETFSRKDAGSFVYVVINGDSAVFREGYITKGEEGGVMAAKQLHVDVKNHVEGIYPDADVGAWHIIVQVALNLEGLSRKLHSAELARSTTELPAFARGFSRSQGLFSFVDIGHGKDMADFKVHETVRAMVDNLQCKHILFSPCHDKAYLTKLQQEASPPTRLMLLETTPLPPEFQELGLRRAKFPQVFRSEPLPDSPLAVAPSISPSRPVKFLPASLFGAPAPTREASVSASLPTRPARRPKDRYYLVNAAGERVDEPSRFDPQAERRFRERGEREGRGACNRFHLTGVCEERSCTYYHGPYLDDASGKAILKSMARAAPCYHRNACKTPECYWGHHCKAGKQCTRPNCKFADTHGMDLTPVERVYEDGTREKVPVEKAG